MTEKVQTQKSTKKSTKTSVKKSTAKKKVLQQVAEPVENNVNTVLEEKETDNMNTEIINTISTINTTVENDDANATAENNDVNTVTEKKENAIVTNETIINNTTTDNSTSTTTAAALKISGITQEQLLQILKQAGVDTTQVNITTKAPKIHDKLTYLDEEKTQAICSANNEHVFNINELDEEARIESMKSGLCPHCLSIMKQAAEIKAASGFRTRTVSSAPTAKEDKAGYKIRNMVANSVNNIPEDYLRALQEQKFCRENFKLAYPLLLNITGMSAEEITIARKDAKGRNRYSASTVYTINEKQFILTNDLYTKNYEPLSKFFVHLMQVAQEEYENSEYHNESLASLGNNWW